ncbi:MAG TPA: YbaB/EbfC family nucleoid-associated protein [Streptomyces sp.]
MSVDPTGLREYAEELRNDFLRLEQEAPIVHARARAIRITAKSPDGFVTATVDARGELTSLDLDPRIYRRQNARVLADSITETIQRAAGHAREEVLKLFEQLIPVDQMRAHLEGDLETVLEQMSRRLPKES